MEFDIKTSKSYKTLIIGKKYEYESNMKITLYIWKTIYVLKVI